MMFRILATGVVLALSVSLIACADTPSTSVAQGPRATWEEAGVGSYTITVERMCFCPDLGPYVVTVVDDEIASVTLEGEEIDPNDETLQSWPFTVDELFDEVDEAEEGADDVAVSYDEQLGYPSRIAIDWMENAVDDEIAYVVRDLQVGA